jgi:hypothetical protein
MPVSMIISLLYESKTIFITDFRVIYGMIYAMKPTLIDKPNNYNLQQMLVNFAGGVPLSADQLNFLLRHEKALSHYGLDPLLKYYLKPYYRKYADHHSFLLHQEEITEKSAKELRNRLQLILEGKKKQRIKLAVTPEQFLQFKNAAVPSLILYHGNQFLTGAPFYLGGIPHVVFFQWGNLFGVAKYIILPDEKALKSNVLIYFEDMYDRNLQQCVDDFKHDLKHELQPHEQPAHTHHLEKQIPHENYQNSMFRTPTLSLSLNTQNNKDK